jgi:hypothetical protein
VYPGFILQGWVPKGPCLEGVKKKKVITIS